MNSPLHEKKKTKNYALLTILLVIVVILFATGMIKMMGRM